ncbi:DUF2497 domain-containing protein [Parasphingopyxis sp. CP4]|uniref:DUF2497 domain-containing protein n=1 Tax=Parasphingopyxis sp. CP4 TaxID=2724527 RepID=UPI0015A1F8A9|nr:DUF2497 domain-containing protein [Parasphingopyxis sp. CP4]QLC21335.1 DUF2497 domain-containing protein [Parasphingopyxis sp. CP4]
MGDVNHEPTMEEILASIKKIIAEDGEAPVAAPDARSQRKRPVIETSEPPVADDVLELTETVQAETPDESVAEEAAPTHVDTESAKEAIASDETVRASKAALAALAAIAKPADTHEAEDDAHPLEGLVREMLRPMLKEWLDDNLPAIVEEMVAREIARIAAGQD